MSTSASQRFAAFAITAVLAAAPLLPTLAADKPPDFGGLWLLDTNESETLQQKMDAMRQSGGGPPGGGGWHGGGGGMGGGMGGHHGHGGGGGGYGGGGGGYGGQHGGGGGGERDSTRAQMMNDLAHPAMSLVIEPGDDAYVLSERGRALEVLVLNDTTGSSIEPDALHLQAHWKGKHLIAEKTGPRGTMTQDYELSGDGKKLTVNTKLEGREGRPPLELKRVYNRSEGGEEPPSASAPQPLAPAPPDSTRK